MVRMFAFLFFFRPCARSKRTHGLTHVQVFTSSRFFFFAKGRSFGAQAVLQKTTSTQSGKTAGPGASLTRPKRARPKETEAPEVVFGVPSDSGRLVSRSTPSFLNFGDIELAASQEENIPLRSVVT